MNDKKKQSENSKVTFNIDKVKDFPDWYDKALSVGEIVDTRYPLKGMIIWRPYGFKSLKLMLNIIENLLDLHGHEETYFPMLIPASIFGKERDFLKGFSGEAFVVTKAGTEKLGEELYIRPTSETVIYDSVKLWIRSTSDLPLKIYQTVNTFRHETKTTRPLLRVREIVKFKEAHTFHPTASDAEEQIKEGIKIYREFFDTLLVPYKVLRTPSWDTFAGAMYNYDFMSVMPDGKAIELGSVINLGDKFAKAFDIKYLKADGSNDYVHQTCYGISERELGALISIHGDNNGLILPPSVAPVQVVIVPILKDSAKEVNARAKQIEKELVQLGLRVKIDSRDKTMGEKFYELEAKGIPLRIEIGPKEIKEGKMVVFRRDTREKINLGDADFHKITKLMADIGKNLRQRALDYLDERVLHFSNVKELQEKYTERIGMVGLPWCGDEKCGRSLEEKIGIPTIGYDTETKIHQVCASCGKSATTEMFFGKTY
ncbi:MAG: proline--tRNA ligase [Candidatus Micrarchaeota archaeon]|nr:proline--tRNA ligase [Candidatus Micrarchaeota archaeon]